MDVVGIGDVLGVLHLVAVLLTLSQDLLAGYLVPLHHLNSEDVIDLDVVSGDAIVEEVRGEHHIVALVPEFGVVLVVEVQHVTRTDETEPRHYQEGQPEPHEEGGVVEGSLGDAEEDTGEHGSEGAQHVIDLHPVEVHHAEGLPCGVLRVLTLSHLQVASYLTNETATLSETLVVNELNDLETSGVQEP